MGLLVAVGSSEEIGPAGAHTGAARNVEQMTASTNHVSPIATPLATVVQLRAHTAVCKVRAMTYCSVRIGWPGVILA